ncbi:hypothetical protein UT300003_00820 [Clostridium sardiniense]
MGKFDEFDLDVKVKTNNDGASPYITSKSLCTPGCVTGVLMCITQSCVSCNSCIKC